MKRFAIALCMGLAGTAAHAVEESDFIIDTTGDLADLCSVQPGELAYAEALHMCVGFIVGVHHMHEAVKANLGEGVYCIPEDDEEEPTRGEVAAAFAKYVAENPDVRATEAHEGVLSFGASVYPCS